MRKPPVRCKHALYEIAHKWHYTSDELGDGCWYCGGPLVPEGRPPRSLGQVGMDDDLRARAHNDPVLETEILAHANRPLWVCPPCQMRHYEEMARIAARCLQAPGTCRPVSEFVSEMRSAGGIERYVRETLARIAEVEGCVADCPYRDRLDTWRRTLPTT
jgi:hypothetical protein